MPELAVAARSLPADERRIVLVRHAQTTWSTSGRHTGRTDLELTETGRFRARAIGAVLADQPFAAVLTSPLRRARATCELAGLGPRAEVRADLAEWDYGGYEGLTTPEIRRRAPTWSLWEDGAPGGESPADVQRRVDRVVEALEASDGDIAVFSHGHLLRALTVRWLGLPVAVGARLALDTGAVGVLGYLRDQRALRVWNDTSHLDGNYLGGRP